MRLSEWRQGENLTQAALAEKLGVTQPLVSSWERPRNTAIPGPALMVDIYVLTGGAVVPNDFYDLPALVERALEKAA